MPGPCSALDHLYKNGCLAGKRLWQVWAANATKKECGCWSCLNLSYKTKEKNIVQTTRIAKLTCSLGCLAWIRAWRRNLIRLSTDLSWQDIARVSQLLLTNWNITNAPRMKAWMSYWLLSCTVNLKEKKLEHLHFGTSFVIFSTFLKTSQNFL